MNAVIAIYLKKRALSFTGLCRDSIAATYKTPYRGKFMEYAVCQIFAITFPTINQFK